MNDINKLILHYGQCQYNKGISSQYSNEERTQLCHEGVINTQKALFNEISQLQTDKNNVIQQAEIQAQEARTQKAIVIEILSGLGLPLEDYNAISLVLDKFDQLQTEVERLRKGLGVEQATVDFEDYASKLGLDLSEHFFANQTTYCAPETSFAYRHWMAGRKALQKKKDEY